MDSGTDTSVYSAKKTYNRLIGKLDCTHTQMQVLMPHTHTNTFIQNPIC